MILPLLVAAIFAQFADLITFGMAVDRMGISAELNPFIRALYGFAGIEGIVALKVGTAMLLVLWAYHPTGWIVLLVALLVGALGAASNTIALANA